MLTEIALTPHTFTPSAVDTRWREQIAALNRRLLYFGNQCPIVFSNLNAGDAATDWVRVVEGRIASIRTQDRRAAMDLLDRIKKTDLLVARPSHGKVNVPVKEAHWVREGIAPAAEHRIDHIVASHDGVNTCREVLAEVIGIHELDTTPLWQGVTVTPSVPPNIAAQMSVLRPILLHAQFLAVVLPYGLSNETDWFFALLNRVLARPMHGLR